MLFILEKVLIYLISTLPLEPLDSLNIKNPKSARPISNKNIKQLKMILVSHLSNIILSLFEVFVLSKKYNLSQLLILLLEPSFIFLFP